MARSSGVRQELIRCEFCGEMYSTTYKRCPFCNGDGTGRWDDPQAGEAPEAASRTGGKRLAAGGGTGGGGPQRTPPSIGAIVGGLLSLILIIAAICIVVSVFRTLTGGKQKPPAPSAPVTESQPVESTPAESQPVESQPAESTPAESQPVESTSVQSETPPQPTLPAAPTAPTGFTLSKSDFTFFSPGEIYDMGVTFTPAGTDAEVVWKSSDPNIASISWNGRVTAVSAGTVTLTATVEGVGEQTCICRCTFTDPAAPTPGGESPATSNPPAPSNLTLSREDFTLAFAGDSWQLVVSGSDSPVTWASSKPEVASVSSNGTVTAVSKGTCTVTATVDGTELECIVRCKW